MKERIVRQPPSTQAHFAQVPTAEIERSTFDRSHGWKGTLDEAGKLIPIFWDEALPGDTFSMSANVFMRLSTPLKPIMDNMQAQIHWFFVPNRLLWDKWEIFMGEVRGPSDPKPEDLVVPQATVDMATAAYGDLADHLGLPIGQAGVGLVQDLPFRAYELIHYEWYRDQNVQMSDHPAYAWQDIMNRTADNVKRRMKKSDYFTRALPWPQKGEPVVIPLGETAPVFGIGKVNQVYNDPNVQVYETGGTGVTQYASGEILDGELQSDEAMAVQEDPDNPGFPNIYADLTQATATSINDLRTAFQIQRLLERDARGGTRYIELILSHFGVSSDDARLQRPEYLGAGSSAINIHPVASTVETTDAPQANLAATGTSLVKGGFTHSFTEHGIVMGLLSVQADLTYQQGVERQWKRSTRYDYYWPALSHLGEQAIIGEELYFDTTGNEDIFGYQERYAEYRYKPSRITGVFRSNHPTSLDPWHLAQDFAERPVLNYDFIKEDPPLGRVVAVPSEPHFICDAWFNFKCTRPMPVYSVPGLIDHF